MCSASARFYSRPSAPLLEPLAGPPLGWCPGEGLEGSQSEGQAAGLSRLGSAPGVWAVTIQGGPEAAARRHVGSGRGPVELRSELPSEERGSGGTIAGPHFEAGQVAGEPRGVSWGARSHSLGGDGPAVRAPGSRGTGRERLQVLERRDVRSLQRGHARTLGIGADGPTATSDTGTQHHREDENAQDEDVTHRLSTIAPVSRRAHSVERGSPSHGAGPDPTRDCNRLAQLPSPSRSLGQPTAKRRSMMRKPTSRACLKCQLIGRHGLLCTRSGDCKRNPSVSALGPVLLLGWLATELALLVGVG